MTIKICGCHDCLVLTADVTVAVAAGKVANTIVVAPKLPTDPNSFIITVARNPEVTA